MAIDKKRAEKARKSQLEGFINTCLPLDRQSSSGEILRKENLSDPIKAESSEFRKRKKSTPDYIRLDISGFKEYLRTMAGYDSIRYGKTVSVTKYIRNLISADMDHRKTEYDKVKNI